MPACGAALLSVSVFARLAVVAIWLVVLKARRDSADPARCVGLRGGR